MKKQIFIAILLIINSYSANAHEGHDHGGTKKQLELKPSLNLNQSPSNTKGLNGVIIADPNYSAVVQSPFEGQLTLNKIYLGQVVKKGTPIAELNVIAPISDTVQINSSIADIDSKIRNTQTNLHRMKGLNGFVSPRQIESLEIELAGLRQQRSKLSQIHQKRIILKAPIDGVINKINVMQGQMISPKETVIEIIQSNKILIEAYYYNGSTQSIQALKEAKTTQNQVIQLKSPRFLPSLKNQARVVQFEPKSNVDQSVMIGQSVIVY